jgi:hypothetical protein
MEESIRLLANAIAHVGSNAELIRLRGEVEVSWELVRSLQTQVTALYAENQRLKRINVTDEMVAAAWSGDCSPQAVRAMLERAMKARS